MAQPLQSLQCYTPNVLGQRAHPASTSSRTLAAFCFALCAVTVGCDSEHAAIDGGPVNADSGSRPTQPDAAPMPPLDAATDASDLDATGADAMQTTEDAAAPVDSGVQPQPPFGVRAPLGRCESDEDAGVGAGPTLTMIPEQVRVVKHLDASCPSLASSIVLRNTSSERAAVTSIRVSSEAFVVHTPALPLVLEPYDAIRVQLDVVGDDDRVTALLAVNFGGSCLEYAVRGLTTPDLALTISRLAIDFGRVRAGEQSSVQELLLRIHGEGSSRIGGFGFDHPAFSFADEPLVSAVLNHCDTLLVKVLFRAPAEPGLVTGRLGFEVVTETEIGTAVGSAVIPLSGSSYRQ